jgi:hypothetical protein
MTVGIPKSIHLPVYSLVILPSHIMSVYLRVLVLVWVCIFMFALVCANVSPVVSSMRVRDVWCEEASDLEVFVCMICVEHTVPCAQDALLFCFFR